MSFIADTHCHFENIDIAKSQLVQAYDLGLRLINIIGTDIHTSRTAVDIVRQINDEKVTLGMSEIDVQSTIGLHPHEAKDLLTQQQELNDLYLNDSDVICSIGECGYDFYYNHSSKEDQTKAFRWQIELAHEKQKVLVIHTRDAWEETFSLLDEMTWPKKTVFHCFTGGVSQAKRCVDNGAHISISGIVTFKNAQALRDAVVSVPLSQLVTETDAPWLSPVPYRGKSNECQYVKYVVDEIVRLRSDDLGESQETIVETLYNNAKQLFR